MRSIFRPLTALLVCGFLLQLHGCAILTEPDEDDEIPRSSRRAVLERRNDLEPDEDAPAADAQPQLDEEMLANETMVAPTPTATASPNPEAELEPTPAVQAPGGQLGAPAPRPTPAAAATDADSVVGLINPGTPPQSAAALRLIEEGRTLLVQSQFDRAQERFERAVAVDPSNAYGYYFLAKAHYAAKQYDQATNFATRATGLSVRTSTVWQSRIAALQGQILEAIGRYPEARQAYQRAAQADPHNSTAQTGLSRVGQ